MEPVRRTVGKFGFFFLSLQSPFRRLGGSSLDGKCIPEFSPPFSYYVTPAKIRRSKTAISLDRSYYLPCLPGSPYSERQGEYYLAVSFLTNISNACKNPVSVYL